MSNYLSWHVGMKVIADREGGWPERTHPALVGCVWPENGKVYTIREIDYLVASYGEGVVIWLDEIRNKVVKFRDLPAMEVGFAARGFRPLQTSKTSIEIFERLLNPSKGDTIRELEAEIFEYEPTEVPFR